MAENKTKDKQVSMTNTKKDILTAYNELLQELKAKEESQVAPEKKVEEKKKKESVRIASSLSTDGVVQGISNLKLEIGKLLTDISDKMENEVKRFEEVQSAIVAKDEELQEIYEISRSAHTFAALVEANNRKKVEFEAEIAATRDDFEKQVQKAREDWKIEESKRKEEQKACEDEESKKRDREKEEYLYSFARQKKLEMDKFQDEKTKQQKELQQKIEDQEAELWDREQKIAEREEELVLLRKKVDNLPKELETCASKIAKETGETLTKEFQNSKTLMQKEFAGEKNVFLAKIESMGKTIQQQEQELEKLSRQLESAYKRIEDIAVKTVATGQSWKPAYQNQDREKETQR